MSERKSTNFLRETIEVLSSNGKSIDDIRYITGGGYNIDKNDFMIVAAGIEYDDGFGHQYIPSDLVIVGDGWWLERSEYDGSEWWVFRTPPQMEVETKTLVGLNIEEYNEDKYVFKEVAK